MQTILSNFSDIIALLVWGLMWALGGVWIVRRAFNLRPNEEALIGFGIGLVIENWLANYLARILPLPTAFWISSAMVLLIGFVFSLPLKNGLRSLFSFKILKIQWVTFLFLSIIFFMIGRGLSIFDDYAHLPTTSLLATGDIPPHFSLDPSISYAYHYFLMLFAAQIMRIADMFVWTALDLSRGLSFGLSIVLTGLWVQRITRSAFGGFVGGLFAAFATGTRWLLLLLPPNLLTSISQDITMLGSAAASGATLAEAMINPWSIQGAGPLAYPFAFVNGILTPGIMAHGPNGMIGSAIAIPLLMTFNKWRGWLGAAISVILISASGLLGESVLVYVTWAILILLYIVTNKTFKIPRSLWQWFLVIIGGSLLGTLTGGALGDIAKNLFLETFAGVSPESYQSVGFQFVWPPTIVSAHLGVLSLFNPKQLIVALFEIGPVVLIFPLLLVWGIKAFRLGRWYEAALVISACLSLLLFFVNFTGSTGVRNTSRLYSVVGICSRFAVPLAFLWVAHRSEVKKAIVGFLGFITIFGGIVLLAIQLVAIQKPVYSYLIDDLDARMTRNYWNRLEPGTLIFDTEASRSPIIFGLFTNSHRTWYEEKPEWQELVKNPDPLALQRAGFHYAYFDSTHWDQLSIEIQDSFDDPCVEVVEEYKQDNPPYDFRRLLDIHQCVENKN